MDRLDTRGDPPTREHYPMWRGVRVTDVALAVNGRTYQIKDLRGLREQRGSSQPALRAALGMILAESVAAGVALAGIVYAQGTSPAVYMFAGSHAIASTILIGLCLVRWPTPIELWAEYRGQPTRLYSCPDRFEFGKVRRAIERAMFSHRLLK
jgi:Family of unknown function (DUF6232)